MNTQLRNQILVRDHHQCQQCGNRIKLDIHHIIPRLIGGTDNPNNLISLCRSCHKQIENKHRVAPTNPVNGIQPTKILSGGRISLPKIFLTQTKLKEGDFVGISFSENKITIYPVTVEVRK